MHRSTRAVVRPRLWLLAAIAAIVAVVGLLPMFGGGTAYAVGVNLNQSAAESQFVIPGSPLARTRLPLAAATQPGFNLKVNSTNGFPASGQLLVSDGAWGDGDKNGAEIMTYSAIKGEMGTATSITLPIAPGDIVLKRKTFLGAMLVKKTLIVNVTLKAGVPKPFQGQIVYWNTSIPNPIPPNAMDQQGFWRVVRVTNAPPPTQFAMVKVPVAPCTNIVNTLPPKDNRIYDVLCGFTITQRGPAKPTTPPMIKKLHPTGSKVKLATVTTAAVLPTDGLQTTLIDGDLGTAGNNNITAIRGGCALVAGETFATCPNPGLLPTPFAIQLSNTTGWPAAGFITINHQDLQTSNLLGGQAGEFAQYDLASCGVLGANQICIINRALQPPKRAYVHRPDGYTQPSQTPKVAGPLGRTKVSLHFQMQVKSNAGFFPAGNLLVCDATNPLTNCELIGHHNAADKIKVPAPTEFHMTERCAPAANFNKIPMGCGKAAGNPTHLTGSIVTGADAFVHCRNGNSQPGVDTDLGTAGYQEPAAQVPGTSVGITAVCYTETQPKEDGAKVPGPVQIVGQDLNVINSIQGQPFLSTGGFTHVVLGAVPHVDDDGTSDGVLNLISPCITDFTPGTNLQVNVTLAADKTLIGTDTGTINVVLDTVHDAIEGNADDCDDPSGTDAFISTTYDSATGEPAIDKGDDTDRDGCVDEKELRAVLNQGGLRDPWNPYDWYDINHDGAVSITVDILQVAQSFGVPANYLNRKDRGALNFGPFSWNKSAPNGSIDVPGDVLGVAQQFSSACLHDPNTGTATHELYDTGVAWPAGNGPWYIQLAGNGVPNH